MNSLASLFIGGISLTQQKEVLIEIKNHIGWIKLNRRKALNALSTLMIDDIQDALDSWEHNLDVYAVYISSNMDQVFCAGGDVKALYEHHLMGDDIYPPLYLAKQYLMDYHIHTYKKPVLVYVDGIVFGGGVGLATAAKYLVVSKRVKLSMPETKIGFFPDVGTTRMLNDLPNHIGKYMGLLGITLNDVELLELKIADYKIDAQAWKNVEYQLQNLTFSQSNIDDEINRLLSMFNERVNGKSQLFTRYAQISRIFSKSSIKEMILEINKNDSFETEILNKFKEMSPSALFVTYELLKRTEHLSLYDCFKYEHSLSKNVINSHDFIEGVRSLLIDKDKKFNYQPQHINDVSPKTINEIFDFEDINENHLMDQMKGLNES